MIANHFPFSWFFLITKREIIPQTIPIKKDSKESILPSIGRKTEIIKGSSNKKATIANFE